MLIKGIQDRFQVTLTLVLFFPVILEALFKISSDETGSVEIILKWGFMISSLIAAYVLFEIIKNKNLLDWVIKSIHVLLLIEIALFAPVLYLLAQVVIMKTGGVYMMGAYFASICGIVFIPIIIFLLLFINLIYILTPPRNKVSRTP